MKSSLNIAAIVAAVFISSCAQQPPPAPTTTPTSFPTQTAIPPTPISQPSPAPTEVSTPTPDAGFILPLPKDKPIETWEGIRIMPGAIAGEEPQPAGYAFTTLASTAEIERFYIKEMRARGWEYVATGTTEKGGLFIVFEMGASVSVIPVGDEAGTNYVLISLG